MEFTLDVARLLDEHTGALEVKTFSFVATPELSRGRGIPLPQAEDETELRQVSGESRSNDLGILNFLLNEPEVKGGKVERFGLATEVHPVDESPGGSNESSCPDSPFYKFFSAIRSRFRQLRSFIWP